MMKRLGLIIPWAIFLAIVLGWIGYWMIVADTAEKKLATWSAEQRQAGAEVSYTGIRRHGFPVLMRLEIVDFTYQPARSHWRATTPSLDLNIQLLDPGLIAFQSKQPITVTRADGSNARLTADALLASIHTRNNRLAEVRVEGNGLSYQDAKPGVLRIGRLMLGVRPDPRDGAHEQVSVELSAVQLARPVRSFEQFGQDISAIRGAIVIEQAAKLAERDPADFLRPWREAGGRARIERIELNWGPLEGSGEGDASVDDQRRLVGTLRLAVPHPGPAMQALALNDRLSRNERQLMEAIGIGLAASGRAVTFTVLARDGVLKVEGSRVRDLPPLY